MEPNQSIIIPSYLEAQLIYQLQLIVIQNRLHHGLIHPDVNWVSGMCNHEVENSCPCINCLRLYFALLIVTLDYTKHEYEILKEAQKHKCICRKKVCIRYKKVSRYVKITPIYIVERSVSVTKGAISIAKRPTFIL